MGGYDYTCTLRTRRRRARLKAERLAAAKVAKIARRVELDARRVAQGLPPAKTSTERARQCRAKKAQVKTEQWYSSGFLSRAEAKAFLVGLHPTAQERDIEAVLDRLQADCHRWQLHFNKFVLTHGIEQARLQRAIFEQVMETKFGDDCECITAAIQVAEKQGTLVIDASLHPRQQYQIRLLWLDQSQVKWREGNLLNCAA
jgi:hypothetical protein